MAKLPPNTGVYVRVPLSVDRRLHEIAKATGLSISAVAARLIVRALGMTDPVDEELARAAADVLVARTPPGRGARP